MTIEANGTTKTFKYGEHVTFGANSGGKQTLTFSGAEFVGYGTEADFQGRDVKDKLVVWVPNLTPPAPGAAQGGGRGAGRARQPVGRRREHARREGGGAVRADAGAAVRGRSRR